MFYNTKHNRYNKKQMLLIQQKEKQQCYFMEKWKKLILSNTI